MNRVNLFKEGKMSTFPYPFQQNTSGNQDELRKTKPLLCLLRFQTLVLKTENKALRKKKEHCSEKGEIIV